MLKYIYSLILAMSFVATYASAQSGPAEDSQVEIKKVIDSFYEAWNNHDAKKMASFIANDGDLRTAWNEYGKNRKEIEDILTSRQANQMRNSQVEQSIKSIKMIKPNIALVDVDSHITGMLTKGAKQYAPLHHHVVFILVNRDNKWQILIGRPF